MTSARGVSRLAAGLLAVVLIGACGSDDATSSTAVTSEAVASVVSNGSASSSVDTAPSASPTSGSIAGSFPVTIEHALGQTVVESEPERVVALIDRDIDTLLALGVIPVGVHSRYGFERGVGPWAESALAGAEPIVWTGREFNYEAIAAAEPDLIVYATSGGEQDVYDTLTAIAPTIGLPEGATPYGSTVEETTILIARALGRDADGQQLLDDFDAYLAAQAEQYPAFADTTINYLDVFPGGVWSYAEDYIILATLYDVGFKPIPATETVPAGESYVEVSSELLANYDADVLIVYPYDQTVEQIETENPTFAALQSVVEDRLFLLDDLALANASVLSIPYALDRLLPEIDAALQD